MSFLSKPTPSHRIDRDELLALYGQGEEAVIGLVEGLVERIVQLEARLEVLEAQVSKTS